MRSHGYREQQEENVDSVYSSGDKSQLTYGSPWRVLEIRTI